MYAPDGRPGMAPDFSNPALPPWAAGVFDQWGNLRYVVNEIMPQFAGDMLYLQSLAPGVYI